MTKKIVSSISLYSAVDVFSCPGSSVPTLVTATFEIRVISGQKTKRQKYKKDKKVEFCDVRAVSHSCNVFFF